MSIYGVRSAEENNDVNFQSLSLSFSWQTGVLVFTFAGHCHFNSQTFLEAEVKSNTPRGAAQICR